MGNYAFGIDLGGTAIKMGLFETSGKLLEDWEIPTRTEGNGKYILGDIARAVEKKMEEKMISKKEIQGIGIGVPGPVLEDGSVSRCENLGWEHFQVEKELEKLVGLPVKAGNDANVAAMGEMWQGGGEGYKNLVMVTLGTGIGGGIIINGHMVSGSVGAAGEIGHLTMNDEEERECPCGKKGCLEQYASATGIVYLTKKYLSENPDAVTVLQSGFTAKEIFDAAKEGDTVALLMVEEVARLLGKGLAQIACVVNPDIFVVGGGMAKAGGFLLERIQKYYIHYSFPALRGTQFALAKLSNQAGIYGGVKLVL